MGKNEKIVWLIHMQGTAAEKDDHKTASLIEKIMTDVYAMDAISRSIDVNKNRE